jgi:hypothetical protein
MAPESAPPPKKPKGMSMREWRRSLERKPKQEAYQLAHEAQSADKVKLENYGHSDRLAVALFCGSGFAGLAMLLIPKTPIWIVAVLVAMCVFAVYPVLHFFRSVAWRSVAFACVIFFELFLGYSNWPRVAKVPAIAVDPPTRQEVLDRIARDAALRQEQESADVQRQYEQLRQFIDEVQRHEGLIYAYEHPRGFPKPSKEKVQAEEQKALRHAQIEDRATAKELSEELARNSFSDPLLDQFVKGGWARYGERP